MERNGVGVLAWIACTMTLCALSGTALDQAAHDPLDLASTVDLAPGALVQVLEKEAKQNPADAAPALRRAYTERQTAGRLNKGAVDALRRSYALEPLGPDATAWRLRFVFDNWSDAPRDLQRSALLELETAFPRHGWAMRHLPQSVADPAGRMIANLTFHRLRAEQIRSSAASASR